jgi:hypothetical protein
MGPLTERNEQNSDSRDEIPRKVKGCSRLDRTSNEDIRVELRGLQIIETDGKTTSTEWKTINCRSKLGNTSQREKYIQFRIVFWDVLPCKIIVYRRFRGTCCLHHQG